MKGRQVTRGGSGNARVHAETVQRIARAMGTLGTAAIAAMAVGLTQSMLNEQPPNDGHRMNILSTTFTHIGIAVYRDSSGTVWLTQDFSN